MQDATASAYALGPTWTRPRLRPLPAPSRRRRNTAIDRDVNEAPPDRNDEHDEAVDWSEEDIVFLHWRLLQEVRRLADPAAPLADKLDTLRWVFTEREKDTRPFSFVNCLRVVGCSPLSPTPYCGLVDAEEVRDQIRGAVKAWLVVTLERYPEWVRKAVATNPGWVEARLAGNPQWINQQTRRMCERGDLFA